MSWVCHHPDGLVRVTHGTREVGSHIMGIVKPPTTDSYTLKTNTKLVLDERLLERVLTTHIFTVKSIPHSCRISFSQALKDVRYKVVFDPGSICSSFWLLLLPRCTL